MIQKLKIKNFKSHRDTDLILKPLTILTGLNGSGKSTILQALLLLRQSFKKNRLDKVLELNKPLCDIGVGKDALYQFADDEENNILFSIENNGNNFQWIFSAKESENLKSTFLPLIKADIPVDLNSLSLFSNDFQYISAGRLPELKYGRDDYAVEKENQISIEKGYGELVAQYLFHHSTKPVDPALKNSKSKFDELIYQTTAWEKEINSSVQVIPIKEGEAYTIKYSFDGKKGLDPTDEFKTENVGFGLTYALPIIVSILSSKKNSLLLIENPEAHLHPKGQSKLAELIALASQNGIQIIVETHSDHIINAILVACKKFEDQKPGIDKNLIQLYYFGEKDDRHASKYENIEILEGGKISSQPNGFFDQTQNDLEFIMGF